jgi:hypothetical protein
LQAAIYRFYAAPGNWLIDGEIEILYSFFGLLVKFDFASKVKNSGKV